MSTDAVVAGGLGLASFATATDTPGFESVATVTFRTAGRVEMGGKVELVMPSETDAQYGWRFTDGAPMSSMETSGAHNAPGVVFVASGGVSTPTATAVGYNVSTRRLVFTVAAHGLLQNTTSVSYTHLTLPTICSV